MDEDARCRLLLGVKEHCSEEELRQAYRDMVKVWHPDRFMHDERLQKVAQDKLKEINGAYEYLRARIFEEGISPQPEPAETESRDSQPQPGSSSLRAVLLVLIGVICLSAATGVYLYTRHQKQITGNAKSLTDSKPTKGGAATNAPDWTVLSDAVGTHWRGFRRDSFPSNWRIENGVLETVEGAQPVDLISVENYQDFDLELEWRISPGGNSGIMFHVSEEAEQSWFSGPEMQLLDDTQHSDGLNPKTSAGSLFDLIAPVNKHLNPVGEWNQTRILVSGPHVEYWLNGSKIVEYELGGESFRRLVAGSQFADKSSYARQKSGHIVLQAYERQVAFRNIRIRRLAAPPENNEP